MCKAMRCWLGAAGLGLVFMGGVVSAQETVRVRGTIEGLDGSIYVVKARDGSSLKLTLAANAGVAASQAVSFSTSSIRMESHSNTASAWRSSGRPMRVSRAFSCLRQN